MNYQNLENLFLVSILFERAYLKIDNDKVTHGNQGRIIIKNNFN